MSDETWLNAKKAVELGFADEILFTDKPIEGSEEQNALSATDWQPYSTRVMGQAMLNRLIPTTGNAAITEETATETDTTEAVLESGLTASTEEMPQETQEETSPSIGLDGKAKDGSMPYVLLEKQLEFLI